MILIIFRKDIHDYMFIITGVLCFYRRDGQYMINRFSFSSMKSGGNVGEML